MPKKRRLFIYPGARCNHNDMSTASNNWPKSICTWKKTAGITAALRKVSKWNRSSDGRNIYSFFELISRFAYKTFLFHSPICFSPLIRH